MKQAPKFLALAILITPLVGCPRPVAVESEPARMQAVQPIEMAGTYDYEADVNGQRVTGEMVIRRTGAAYAVDMNSSIGAIETSNVRRDGNRLLLDAATPGGDATLELEFRDRNGFSGLGYMGGMAFDVTGTRR